MNTMVGWSDERVGELSLNPSVYENLGRGTAKMRPASVSDAYSRARHFPWITLAIGVAAGLVQLAGPTVGGWLEWRADVWTSGQWWRVATGHLVHWNASHLLWDLGMFFVLGMILERRSRFRLGSVLLTSLALAEVALSHGGRFGFYRGLSALDMALFSLAMGELWRSAARWRWLGAAGWGGILAKIGYELMQGQPIFASAEQGFQVATETHLAGALSAVVAPIALRGSRWIRGLWLKPVL